MWLEKQAQTRKGLECYLEGLRVFSRGIRVPSGISQGRVTIRPSFLRGSLLRKVIRKADRLREEDQYRLLHCLCLHRQVSEWVSDSSCWEFTGELFLPADILIFTQSKPACWMVSTAAQNSPNLRPMPTAKKKFQRDWTTYERILSLSSFIPLPNSSQWWHPGVLSSDNGFLRCWTEKNKHAGTAH